MEAVYTEVREPEYDELSQVMLTDETIRERFDKVLAGMEARGLDQLIVYNDVEHSQNFMYLVGFFTRFEEGLLVLNRDGRAALVLGNENLNKAARARIEVVPFHVPLFSLPNQPGRRDKTFVEVLKDAGVGGSRIGLAGWKLFTSSVDPCEQMFDLPAFIVDAVRECAGDGAVLVNATDIFVGPDGVRRTNNPNEAAHYEFGASLASNCLLKAMNGIREGMSEFELGSMLNAGGQHCNVVTIAASGPRFVKGNMFPSENTVKHGDPISLTVGYSGGLSSRTGYAVAGAEEMGEEGQRYLKEAVFPYYRMYAAWLENIRVGIRGSEMFELVDHMLPRSMYGWKLCPGHLTAEEEWLCSPIYEGSEEILESGMIFQIDIIPSVQGFSSPCAESTVLLADEALKNRIREEYPEVYHRMMKRREYIISELNIPLSEDVLPMCGTVAYLRPFLFNRNCALKLK